MKFGYIKAFVLTCSLLAASLTLTRATAQTIGTCESPQADAYLDIGNVRARILNTGGLFWRSSPNVYEVPKGSGVNAIFASGLWLGGKVDGTLRVAAARYGLWQYWSGPINDDGSAPQDCSQFDHIWKINRTDISHFEETGDAIIDLREWPTGLGAPTLSPVTTDGIATERDGVDNNGDDRVDELGEMRSITDEILSLPLVERIDRLIDLDAGERPDLLGDQMLWWIMNDVGNKHSYLREEAPALGLEIHGTAFAFDLGGGIANTTFYRYRLFNKNSLPLTDAFVGIFADPDLGNFDDDYIASDSVLGLAITYNADNFDEGSNGYGLTPPATGHDFLEGPLVSSPGDTALVLGRRIPGQRQLQMTSFLTYYGGTGVQGDPSSPADYYHYLQGLWKNGEPMSYGGLGRDRDFPRTTTFAFPGDAAVGEFWSERNTDGQYRANPPADRRWIMGSGPFEIQPDSVQDILVGIIWARGTNNFDSYSAVKAVDNQIQQFADSGFRLAPSPDAPIVTVADWNGQATLTWTNDPAGNNYLDSYHEPNPFGDPLNPYFDFEGYEIWQFDSPDDMLPECIEARRCEVLQTFDLVNEVTDILGDADLDGFPERYALGTDSGIQHSFRVDGLTNFRSYYFGVRAYVYSKGSYLPALHSPIARVTAVPSLTSTNISDAALAAAGDASEPDLVASISGIGTGEVFADVVDPTNVRACEYTVVFVEASGADQVDPGSQAPTNYDVYCNDEKIVDGLAAGAIRLQRNAVSFDGLELSILNSEVGIRSFEVVANAAGPLAPPQLGAFAADDEGESNGFPTLNEQRFPERGIQQANSNAIWGMNVGGGANDGEFTTFVSRALRNNNIDRVGIYDYEMRFTTAGGKAYKRFEDRLIVDVPFELWRTGLATPDDRTDDIRLIPAICEVACGAGTTVSMYDLGSVDHGVSDGEDDPFTDWVYWYLPVDDAPGQSGYNSFFLDVDDDKIRDEIFARTVLVQLDAGLSPPYSPALPEIGTIFRIKTNKPFQPGDLAIFNTASFEVTTPTAVESLARLNDIGISPNPYKAASMYEVQRGSDEVRFTNLPDFATIRVFTLNGTLIRTLEKSSPGREWQAWDLNNEKGLPLASGMYIIHVDVPGVGTKVIKFGMTSKKRYP